LLTKVTRIADIFVFPPDSAKSTKRKRKGRGRAGWRRKEGSFQTRRSRPRRRARPPMGLTSAASHAASTSSACARVTPSPTSRVASNPGASHCTCNRCTSPRPTTRPTVCRRRPTSRNAGHVPSHVFCGAGTSSPVPNGEEAPTRSALRTRTRAGHCTLPSVSAPFRSPHARNRP